MCAFWTTLAYSSPRFYHKFPDIKPEFKISGITLHIYEDAGGGGSGRLRDMFQIRWMLNQNLF